MASVTTGSYGIKRAIVVLTPPLVGFSTLIAILLIGYWLTPLDPGE